MSLGQETGKSPKEMRDEAWEIVKIISQEGEDALDKLSDKDKGFLKDMKLKLCFPLFKISGQQLFWLRDIKDKVIA